MQHTLSIAVTIQLVLLVWLARVGATAESEKITYDDHIRPIFRQYCLVCHRGDGKKGDLALDTYAATMEGGASGEVVYAADLDSSRLWDLVSHADEPAMPPNSDKLPDDKLDLIRRWIEGGTLENSGSVAKAPKKTGLAMLAPTTGGKPDGPATMPESLYREPIVHSRRAAAVTARNAQEQAAAELAGRRTAADEAAKKLAAAKAEYDRLKKIEQDAQTTLLQKTQTADTAALAQNQSEATATQARADRELFEKTQEVRNSYRK